MSEVKLNQTTTNYLYIGSGVIIVLMVFLLAQMMQRRSLSYSADHIISVRTSRGLIKANQEITSRKIEEIANKLKLHNRRERVGKFRPLIGAAISKIKKFIQDNPKNDLCRSDIRADIIQRSLSDLVSPDDIQKNIAYNIILDHDEIDNYSDEQMFAYLLKNLDILIQMLQHKICEDGIIDIVELEDILNLLDEDLMHNGRFESPIGQEIGNTYDMYRQPRTPIFIRDSTQLEPFISYEQRSHTSDLDFKGLLKSKNNVKLNQVRSESFRSSNNLTGQGHFSDEELLLEPTYDSQAL